MLKQITPISLQKQHENDNDEIKLYLIDRLAFKSYDKNVVGIDPGTCHIGLAQITENHIYVWEISIARDDTTGTRIQHIWKLMTDLLLDPSIVVIEGASYADRYRQVELQDIRCGATAWAMNRLGNIEVQIVPPLTIRKTVFGSGKIKNPWKELGIPDNAAAALGCALYPIMKE